MLVAASSPCGATIRGRWGIGGGLPPAIGSSCRFWSIASRTGP